jgi:hypothetical protein
MTAAILTGALSLLFIGLLALKLSWREQLKREVVSLQLAFPRGLKPEDVESFIDGLSGLLLPWWRRWLTVPVVTFDILATASGIEHYLSVPRRFAPAIENLLQAAVPAVRFTPADLPEAPVAAAAEYGLSTSLRPLRIEAASLSTKLLTSLQPLLADERLRVQWQLTPVGPLPPVRVVRRGEQHPLGRPPGTVEHNEAATVLRQKQAKALFRGVARIGAEAGDSPERAHALIRQAEVAWHETRAPGVHLQRRLVPAAMVATRLVRQLPPLNRWGGDYNSLELCGLLGWPLEATAIPGVVLGGSRVVAASPLIPREGTVIGDSLFPGDRRPLALDVEARLRHVHVLGPTGTGKSTLLVRMALSDLKAGFGLVLLDPKGDLANDVLARVPPARHGDIVVLDPADESRPVGLNPLATSENNAEVVVENLVGLFKSLYHSSWGPRTDDVLRAALMTLSAHDGTTLCEVPLLLTDPTYRRRIVGQLDDPIGLESFWGWYEALSEAERLTVVGPVLNKIRAFTMRPRIRAIVGQATPSLKLVDVLGQRKVLIVSLASGLLGDEAAALLGALVVAELWHATTARAGLAPTERTPVMAYLDEWSRFLHLPTPMAAVLAEARGLGLGLVVAHQHLAQLPRDARDAVLSNARSRVVFQLPDSDARLVARTMGGVFTADDLQGLGAYEVVAQLFGAGTTQPPASARTRPMPPTTADPELIRSQSRQRYGVPRQEVDAAIRRRQQGRTDAPVQRRPRPGGSS